MKSSLSYRSKQFGGLELRDRLVGEPDTVEFAGLKHFDDDFEQPLVDG
jgi:hypothetical protein